MRDQGYQIQFSPEKNILLKESRGVGFDDIVVAISKGGTLDDLYHKNKKYSHQRILVVKLENYIYAVPYVIDEKRKQIFLKTVYPSRALTAKYLKGGGLDK